MVEHFSHCKDSLRLTTQEFIYNRCTLESIGKRQCELVKSNADILDWVMKIVSNMKKVPLPNIQIFDYVPYTIVPQDVTNPSIPFTNLEEPGEIPFVPFKTLPQNETYGTIRMSRRTPEEIEKYKMEQAQKAKSVEKSPKEKKKSFLYMIVFYEYLL